MAAKEKCRNMNHGRMNVTIRHCTSCGSLLNSAIQQNRCTEEQHANRRRERTPFCQDCGKKLISGPPGQ